MSVLKIGVADGTASALVGLIAQQKAGNKSWERFAQTAKVYTDAVSRFLAEKAAIERDANLSDVGKLRKIDETRTLAAGTIRAAIAEQRSGFEQHIAAIRSQPTPKSEVAQLLAHFQARELFDELVNDDPNDVRSRLWFGNGGTATANDPALELVDHPIFSRRVARHIEKANIRNHGDDFKDGAAFLKNTAKERDDRANPAISTIRAILAGYESVAVHALKDIQAQQLTAQ